MFVLLLLFVCFYSKGGTGEDPRALATRPTYCSVGCHRIPSVCWDPSWNTTGGAPRQGCGSNSSSSSCLEIWTGKKDFNSTEHSHLWPRITSNEQILSTCCVRGTGTEGNDWMQAVLKETTISWERLARYSKGYLPNSLHVQKSQNFIILALLEINGSKLQIFSCKW